MSNSGWFRRLTSSGGAGRSRARRSLVITGIAAALVLAAGLVVLAVNPGQTTLRTTSVASSRQDNSGKTPKAAHTVPPAPAITITSVTPGSGSNSGSGHND